MKKKKLRAGLIGCGRIGSLLELDELRGKPCTHAGGYDAHPKVKLVAGCDINEKRLKKFKGQWKGVKTYTDIQKFLKQDLDIISIAVWTENHYKVLQEVVKSPSVKVILTEKPLASTVRQGSRILRLCEKYGKKLIVYHVRQWDASYMHARELIQEGKLGKIKTVFCQTLSRKPPKLPRKKYTGGTFFHDGTHLIDILRYLCGNVKSIDSVKVKRPWGKDYVESHVYACLKLKKNIEVFVEGGGEREYFTFHLDIQGTHGRLQIGNHIRKLSITEESKQFSGFHELEEKDFVLKNTITNAHYNCVENIVDHIHNGAPLLSTGADALEALRVIEKIYRLGNQKI